MRSNDGSRQNSGRSQDEQRACRPRGRVLQRAGDLCGAPESSVVSRPPCSDEVRRPLLQSFHVACLEAGDHLAGGVGELELLPGDPPPIHVPERIQERFFGLHALRAGHQCRSCRAEARMSGSGRWMESGQPERRAPRVGCSTVCTS
jgi:hypothetical protein